MWCLLHKNLAALVKQLLVLVSTEVPIDELDGFNLRDKLRHTLIGKELCKVSQ